MKTKEYTKEDLTVLWKPDLCYHSKNCVSGLPKVFDPNRKPWIDLSQAEKDQIIETVGTCPSGALSTKNKENNMSQESATKVNIASNGPYIIQGDFKVLDPDGTKLDVKGKAALCRCGASANKPFCDGSHVGAGFEG